MSTYLFLRCLDHDPPLRAADESGQHLSDLSQIRADIAARTTLLAAWEHLDFSDFGHFRNATLRFLAAHPKCNIGIRDEYGRDHPLVEPEGPCEHDFRVFKDLAGSHVKCIRCGDGDASS